jgi:hypothetical protein
MTHRIAPPARVSHEPPYPGALLFDSERPWLEQLHAFKARQNRDA